MSETHFELDGIDELESRIKRLADRLGYIAIQDRTPPNRTEATVGRFDFEPESTAGYFTPPDHDEDDDDGEGWYGGGDQPLAETPDEIAACACRWLREVMLQNTRGFPIRHFRVRLCQPKGKPLETGTVVVRNNDPDEQLKALAEDNAPLTVEERVTEHGLLSMGRAYDQLIRTTLHTTAEMIRMSNATGERMSRQLQSSQEQNQRLVEALLENRAQAALSQEAIAADERDEHARHDLAREALSQLSQAAQLFIKAKSGALAVPDGMEPVLEAITGEPAMVKALSDANVRKMLEDPDNLRGVAEMLQSAAGLAVQGEDDPNGPALLPASEEIPDAEAQPGMDPTLNPSHEDPSEGTEA